MRSKLNFLNMSFVQRRAMGKNPNSYRFDFLKSLHSISHGLSKSHWLLALFMLMRLLSFGQNPFWIYGNKLVHFNGANIAVNTLPQPGNNPELHYTGLYPERNFNVQVDISGEILFFIVDGYIYDSEGYVIARGLNRYDEYYEIASENDLEYFPAGGADLVVTNVPGYCDKYYIISSSQSQFGSVHYDVIVAILDPSMDNSLFSDPARKGSLIHDSTVDTNLFPNFYNHQQIWGLEPNIEGVYVYNQYLLLSMATDWKGEFASLEIIEISSDEKYLLISFAHGTFRIFHLQEDIFTLVHDCNEDIQDFDELKPQGAMEAVQLANGNYKIACSAYCDLNLAVSARITTYDFNANGLLANLESYVPFVNPILETNELTSLEFSPNGDFLWFTKNTAPYIGFVNLTTDQIVYPFAGDLSAYQNSKLEMNTDESGNFVIYMPYANGLARITNPNNPTLSSIVTTTPWASGIAASVFEPEVDQIIYNLQVNNTNSQLIQTFLATGACCASNANLAGHPTYTASGIATWTYGAGNNPWNATSPVYMSGDLIFNSGSKVKIVGMEFRFSSTSNAIINQGASVNLNNSKWTSYECDGLMWPGANILGTPSNDQSPLWGNAQQGYLLLNNNAMIENAILAAEVGTTSSNGGGIVRGFNSSIHNCQSGIKITNYHNYSDNSPFALQNNKCYFSGFRFLIDQHLEDPLLVPLNMADLQYVEGVQFIGCSFINATDYSTYTWQQRGLGIFAFQASFNVQGNNGSWTGLGDNSHTAFVNLGTGIVSFLGINNTYKCNRMEFQNNLFGIFNLLTNNPAITLNNFFLPDQTTEMQTVDFMPAGVYLGGSTGYTVEENHFWGYETPEQTGIGCWVNNSGATSNRIYKNWFDHLRIGNLTELVNVHPDGQKGLQWICNTHTEGMVDMYVAPESQMRHDQGGIQPPNFGGGMRAADNQFSIPNPDCANNSDLLVDPYNFWYVHYVDHGTPITTPDCQSISTNPNYTGELLFSSSYTGTISNYSADCPSELGLGGGGGSVLPSGLVSAMSDLQNLNTAIASQQNLMNAVINAGNTEQLISELNRAFPIESHELRDLLLEKMPLSYDVIREIIIQNALFNPWHFTQVMLANIPLEPDLYSYVMSLQSLPALHKAYLEAAQTAGSGSATLRQMLEQELAAMYAAKYMLMAKMSNTLLCPATDETIEEDETQTEIKYNDFISLWQNEDYATAYRVRAQILINQNDLEHAISLVESADVEHLLADYADLIVLQAQLNNNWNNADAATINRLSLQWNDIHDQERNTALGILWFIGASDELPVPMLPQYLRSEKIPSNYESINIEALLSVYPTLASDEVFITYPADADGIAVLEIIALDGRVIESIPLNGTNGLYALNLEHFAAGMYVASLRIDNLLLAAQKFTVIKK